MTDRRADRLFARIAAPSASPAGTPPRGSRIPGRSSRAGSTRSSPVRSDVIVHSRSAAAAGSSPGRSAPSCRRRSTMARQPSSRCCRRRRSPLARMRIPRDASWDHEQELRRVQLRAGLFPLGIALRRRSRRLVRGGVAHRGANRAAPLARRCGAGNGAPNRNRPGWMDLSGGACQRTRRDFGGGKCTAHSI